MSYNIVDVLGSLDNKQINLLGESNPELLRIGAEQGWNATDKNMGSNNGFDFGKIWGGVGTAGSVLQGIGTIIGGTTQMKALKEQSKIQKELLNMEKQRIAENKATRTRLNNEYSGVA